MKNNVMRFSGVLLLLILFLSACENGLIDQIESARSAAVLPLLTTDAITGITSTTATGNGNITNDGGIPVSARGLCWGADPNPSLSGNVTINSGVEKGAYSDLMTGLSPGTLYYVRAYATNSETTGYGPQVSFTTLPGATASISVSPIGYPEGSGKLDISWDAVSGINIFYDVYYSQTAVRPEAANGPTDLSSTSCILTGLTNYQTYYVWIAAKNATGSNLLNVTRSGPVAPGIPVTGMNLVSRVSLLPNGGTQQMAVTIVPENATNKNITWSSSDTSVATISATGFLTTSNIGNSTITITAEDLGTTENCIVAVTGIITIAGNGTKGIGTSGSTGTATNIAIGSPSSITVDSTGNVYFSDSHSTVNNYCVRKVSPAGVMTTFAGNGIAGTPTEGASAAASSLNNPSGLMADSANNIYISDADDQRIWMIKASDNTFVHIAGNGQNYNSVGFSESGLAVNNPLAGPTNAVLDAAGNLYFVDGFGYRIRQVDSNTKFISTIGGTGTAGFFGDGGPAIEAMIHNCGGIAVDSSGNFYIADASNNRIRKISTDGIITTVAGIYSDPGVNDYNGDGMAATSARLYNPQSVVFDASGNMYFADVMHGRIRKVDENGIITTIAGDGSGGYSGDGGPSISAQLNCPSGVAVDALGNLYIADTNNYRIRKVVR